MTPISESVLMFGPSQSQLGVLCQPPQPAPASALAVIFINAGLIHHVGPNRLHVQLARALAEQGVASLRIDLSGIGDSAARADHLSIYELVRAEPAEAMDALAARGFQRFVLIGLCSGAYSAFHVACEDERVAAAVMINPEELTLGRPGGDGTAVPADGEIGSAWARRYWTNSLFRPRAWLNLLTGRVNYRRLLETLAGQFKSAAASSPASNGREGLQARMLQSLRERALCLLFVCSGDDVSREYLDLVIDRETLAQTPAGRLQRHTLDHCDHLFTRLEDQRRLGAFLVPWLTALAGADQGRLSKPMLSK